MNVFSSPAPLLPEIFALHGKWRANNDAVICEHERLSWRDFCQSNHRFAHALHNAGIGVGDRVGIVMSNGHITLRISPRHTHSPSPPWRWVSTCFL